MDTPILPDPPAEFAVIVRPYLELIEKLTDKIIDWIEWQDDHKRLVRELDVIINGEAGAAAQASLCDIVAQMRSKQKTRCAHCGRMSVRAGAASCDTFGCPQDTSPNQPGADTQKPMVTLLKAQNGEFYTVVADDQNDLMRPTEYYKNRQDALAVVDATAKVLTGHQWDRQYTDLSWGEARKSVKTYVPKPRKDVNKK